MRHDEIQLVSEMRPEAAPYDPAARAAARRRLTTTTGWRWRRPYTIALTGALALAVAATAAQALIRDDGPSATEVTPVIALPELSKMSAEVVLGKAAKAAADTTDELQPRDDQFIVVESQTMYGAFGGGAVNAETNEETGQSRYLYRTKRTIWQSADNTKAGALKIEYLEPKAYPGWPIPKDAREQQGVQWNALPVCGGAVPEHYRTFYTALKKLPTDANGMRAWLYAEDNNKNLPDNEAWTAVGDLLRETYMPADQRAALFKAAGTIPGVTVTENAEDAAGRNGIAVGRVSNGVREDLIFSPDTYEFMGERGLVVDAKAAKAPVGSLVASTAQLKLSVADAAPEVNDPKTGC